MPRPRRVPRSGEAVISNSELARIFNEIADMLEILGEVVYKAVAYRRVADAVERWPEDVAARHRSGEAPRIPGAGAALSAKLAELAETGHLEYYERLRGQVPAGLLDMLRIQGVGPRTVKLLHDELGISSVEELRAAAEQGQLRGLKGLSSRTEEGILEGIARIETRNTRLLLHDADALVAGLLAQLREAPAVRRIEPAGSLRRRRATIGDLDLREADGEIEAAENGSLPRLVRLDEVRGDTHVHSDWTDGVDSVEVMARAARDLGYAYIVLTDHSPSLGITRGLSPERVEEQGIE